LLGKALNYLAGQWPKLNRYVENEAWPIDNNPCHAASGMTGIMPPVELCRAHWIASLQMPAALGSNA
jgi:transposase